MAKPKQENRTFARNRKARHDYIILETYEAGISLMGSEVKSIKDGKVNLQDGHGRMKQGEVWLHGVHVSEYKQANMNNHAERRPRRLLLHRKEIRKIKKHLEEKGMTLVPLAIYQNRRNLIKVELGVGRGKKLHDKRDSIAKKDLKRSMDRDLKHKVKI